MIEEAGMTASDKLRILISDLGGEDKDVGIPLAELLLVVEAAEKLDADLETNTAAGSPNYLITALTALDEALS